MRALTMRVPHSMCYGAVAALMVLLLAPGCTHPIGAKRVSGRQSYKELERSALNSSGLSTESKVVLHRYGLSEVFARKPAEALRALHEQAVVDGRAELLFALAELSFSHAERLQRSVKPGAPKQAPDYFLSSSIYAYWFLMGEWGERTSNRFDRRVRLACDIYNRAVAQGFATTGSENRNVQMTSGVRELQSGTVRVNFDQDKFKWNLDDIESFLPADEFSVCGLTVRDRRDGLGSPLIVVGKALDSKRYARRFPATLFLRVSGDLRSWSAGDLEVSLELISTFDHEMVEVDGRPIYLEGDTTAPLAYGLNDASLWKIDLAQFFSSKERIRSSVYFSQPYQAGRIPVVFVHGTASSPIWWAEMWNTLRTDEVLRERFQYWYFVYNTGNPISQSANRLREELSRKITQLDPEGKDDALRRMVLIGHSQGGLLTKLAATDTGDRLWRTFSTNDMAELKLSESMRAALQTNFFFHPLPFVERVVFISTPHRGSYRVTALVRKLAHLFIGLPETVVNKSAEILQLREQIGLPREIRAVVPTSIDGMSPRNKYLLELAEIPTAPGVKAHSVVAVKGKDVPPQGGDGVVRYTSAHVPYVESEFIVRSGHSCQDKPATIEEVRRILLLHLTESQACQPPRQQ